jgi:hypothetical protein
VFTNEVLCDSQASFTAGQPSSCSPTDYYPRQTQVVMHSLPASNRLPTMPNPCSSVPANPWCPAPHQGKPGRRHHGR